MALDRRRRTPERDRLDHVRVERALREEADRPRIAFEPAGFVLEDADERLADDLALPLRVAHARERLEEPLSRVDHAHAEVFELGLHGLPLALPQNPIVDEHAVQSRAERLMEERGDHGGVDAARKRAEHVLLADSVANGGLLLLEEAPHGPVGLAAAHVEQEVPEDALADRGVCHLGVELDSEPPPRGVRDGRHRTARRRGDGLEAARRRADEIAVAHPDVVSPFLDAAEDRGGGIEDLDLRVPVLAVVGRLDLPAQMVGHELEPVADPEERDVGVEPTRIERGRAFVVHGRRPAAEDDALETRRTLRRFIAASDLAVHALLADAPSNQLRVLAAEIEDENEVVAGLGRHGEAYSITSVLPRTDRPSARRGAP